MLICPFRHNKAQNEGIEHLRNWWYDDYSFSLNGAQGIILNFVIYL